MVDQQLENSRRAGLFEIRAYMVLESLKSSEETYRRDAIPDVHHKTFEWCFDVHATSFPTWLEHDRGLFWICGKAGSGKSTLMKLLSQDNRTIESLKRWADGAQLIFARHYFWYAGSSSQKSHYGLLRSLLYQILSHGGAERNRDLNLQPSLFSDICSPERWQGTSDDLKKPWTYNELYRGLETVEKLEGVKLFLLIDGLDEYKPQHDHVKLILHLKNLAKAANIKLCVSSRPWNDFQNAFGTSAHTLRVEDSTRGDISRYVRDSLTESTLINGTSFNGDGYLSMEDVVQYTTQKANGVFLWIYLVVSALRERLSARMGIAQLYQCVDDFPDELEEYFRELVYRRIHKTWKIHTAQALKLAMLIADLKQMETEEGAFLRKPRNEEALRSVLPYWLLSEGIEDPNFAYARRVQHLRSSQADEIIKATSRYLNSCCKDLLCVVITKNSTETSFLDHRVEFLHRTVYDFLCLDEMQALLEQNVPRHFNEERFLFNVTVACAKLLPANANELKKQFEGSMCFPDGS